MNVKEKLIQSFKENSEWTVRELTERLGTSKQMIHIALNKLMEEKRVQKLGRAPKTVYRLVQERGDQKTVLPEIGTEKQAVLDKEWLLVTDTGDLQEGMAAFDHWCRQRKLPNLKTLGEYMHMKSMLPTMNHQTAYKRNGKIKQYQRV